MSQTVFSGRRLHGAADEDLSSLPKDSLPTLTRNIIYYGCDEALPEPLALRAGPLRLVLVSGQLRHICLGEREVLRRIYVAVRDKDWRTLPSRIVKLSQDIQSDRFKIEIGVENQQGAINFAWAATISGSQDGTIQFAFEGLAKSSFLKNRIGICVLHPIRECAGHPCRLETTDGRKSEGIFPEVISPHQVFKNMKSIAHEIIPGVAAQVSFEGDTFEMEDQRNWSDASYKTYCPPLEVPYPNQIKAGTTVSQSVTLKLQGSPHVASSQKKIVDISFEPVTRPCFLPRLGLGVSSTEGSLGKTAIERLKVLKLAHLRVDLCLAVENCETLLRKAAEQAALLGCSLEIALFLSDDAERELERLRSTVDRVRPSVCHWLIFHQSEKFTNSKWLRVARTKLMSYQPTAKFGGGTNAYFAELGRSEGPGAEFDFLTTSLNPQVHQFDLETLAQNLEAQKAIVQSAKQFWPRVPLAITPITLRPGVSVLDREATRSGKELPAGIDGRQISLFGASWTAGSLKQLCEAGVYSATYYETIGWRGVMESPLGTPLGARFPSIPDGVFPLYHVFADAGECISGHVVPSKSSAPDVVTSFVLQRGGARKILLSNLGPKAEQVHLPAGDGHQKYRVKFLDESSAEWAMTSPESFRAVPGRLVNARWGIVEVDLSPFATASLECA